MCHVARAHRLSTLGAMPFKSASFYLYLCYITSKIFRQISWPNWHAREQARLVLAHACNVVGDWVSVPRKTSLVDTHGVHFFRVFNDCSSLSTDSFPSVSNGGFPWFRRAALFSQSRRFRSVRTVLHLVDESIEVHVSSGRTVFHRLYQVDDNTLRATEIRTARCTASSIIFL